MAQRCTSGIGMVMSMSVMHLQSCKIVSHSAHLRKKVIALLSHLHSASTVLPAQSYQVLECRSQSQQALALSKVISIRVQV